MIIIVLTVLGLCFGSFVNALVWRLHAQGQLGVGFKEKGKGKKATNLSAHDLSIMTGRSMCPNCHHALAWYDLVPVISWLSLRGKCRYCHKSISWQYPVVELVTAGLFAASYIYWPSTLHAPYSILLFVFWLVFLVGFMALVVYDLKWMRLPNRIIYPLFPLVFVQVVVKAVYSPRPLSVIMEAFLGVLCLGGVFYVLFQVSNGKWIGGGDVKLGLLLGPLVGGPAMALLVLFGASVMGSLVSVPLLISGRLKKTSRIPFGPFLIVATILVQLFGQSVWHWYKIHFLII